MDELYRGNDLNCSLVNLGRDVENLKNSEKRQ
jgi:hypothetical protein